MYDMQIMRSGFGDGGVQFEQLYFLNYSVEIFFEGAKISRAQRVFCLLLSDFISFSICELHCLAGLILSFIEFLHDSEIFFFESEFNISFDSRDGFQSFISISSLMP